MMSTNLKVEEKKEKKDVSFDLDDGTFKKTPEFEEKYVDDENDDEIIIDNCSQKPSALFLAESQFRTHQREASSHTYESTSHWQLDEEDETFIYQSFQLFLKHFDDDHDGAIGIGEMGKAMRALGMDPSDRELKSLFTNADSDGSGQIEYEEFRELYSELYSDFCRKGLPEDHLKVLFDTFDRDNSGEVSVAEFKHCLRQLCSTLKDPDVDYICQQADLDGNGTIEFEEFLEYLKSEHPIARLIARKMIRSQIPSPFEHLTAFQNMPSTFRVSQLAALQHKKECQLSYRIKPTLDGSGLTYRGFAISSDTQALQADNECVTLCIELLQCKGIPVPNDDTRKSIISRQIRICVLDDQSPTSNLYMVHALWNDLEEDVWKFKMPDIDWHRFIVRTQKRQISLMFELTCTVKNQANTVISPRQATDGESCTEMSCGWCLLDLVREDIGSVAKAITLDIKGGTIKSSQDILQDEVLSRRSGWRRVTNVFKKKPTPSLVLKLTPSNLLSDKRIIEHIAFLPCNIITPFSSIRVHKMFREILADSILRPKQPLNMTNSQNLPIKIFMHLADNLGLLHGFVQLWDRKRKALGLRQRKDEGVAGKSNEVVKDAFRECLLHMYPALVNTRIVYEGFDSGQTDVEKMALVNNISALEPKTVFTSDRIFTPFHTNEVTFHHVDQHHYHI